MLEFEQAFKIIMDSAVPLGMERVKLDNSVGRILAEDIISDCDMPPFNKSAMDGYACRRNDLPGPLEIIETVPAGKIPQNKIKPGRCSKIMTGAIVPEGADCVIMVEHTSVVDDNTIKFTGSRTADNICFKGEDIRIGEKILESGSLIRPQHIAVLAAYGKTNPLVSSRPEIGIVVTGNELVEPDENPPPGHIRNSNGPQLLSQIKQIGCFARYYGIVNDSAAEIETVFQKSMNENDLVIICGGVSAGDFDFVPSILKQNAMKLLVEKIAIQPGKPTIFGTAGRKFCFGLPGNPVAAFVIFNLLIKPFIYRMMGSSGEGLEITLPILNDFKRKKTERLCWIPVKISGEVAEVIEYHGSAHINAICSADAWMRVPIGTAEIKSGENAVLRIFN